MTVQTTPPQAATKLWNSGMLASIHNDVTFLITRWDTPYDAHHPLCEVLRAIEEADDHMRPDPAP